MRQAPFRVSIMPACVVMAMGVDGKKPASMTVLGGRVSVIGGTVTVVPTIVVVKPGRVIVTGGNVSTEPGSVMVAPGMVAPGKVTVTVAPAQPLTARPRSSVETGMAVNNLVFN